MNNEIQELIESMDNEYKDLKKSQEYYLNQILQFDCSPETSIKIANDEDKNGNGLAICALANNIGRSVELKREIIMQIQGHCMTIMNIKKFINKFTNKK